VPPSIEDPAGDLGNNAGVTLDVLEAVRRGSPETPVVYTSSAAVYGSPTELPISEQTPIAPVSPYGVSKYAAEQYVSLYARLHGLRTASLRLFSVFGPGQRKQVVFDLIAKLAADPDRLEVIGLGSELRDFVFVEDVVAAAIAVMERAPLTGEAYNVASGCGITIGELAGHVADLLGLAPVVSYTGEVRPGDALHWVADISRLRALGFAPAVSVRDGVRRVAAWYAETEARVRA
jgi:UDP-glucose 4-epimerase